MAQIKLLSQEIKWHFTLTEQGFQKRYGKLGAACYSQFLLGGIVNDKAHPPKKITGTHYIFAHSVYVRQT